MWLQSHRKQRRKCTSPYIYDGDGHEHRRGKPSHNVVIAGEYIPVQQKYPSYELLASSAACQGQHLDKEKRRLPEQQQTTWCNMMSSRCQQCGVHSKDARVGCPSIAAMNLNPTTYNSRVVLMTLHAGLNTDHKMEMGE
jgi:hypothetical protein